jgi:hypothetical protein
MMLMNFWKVTKYAQSLKFFLHAFSKKGNDCQFDPNFYVVVFHYNMGRIQKNYQKM